MLLSMCVCVCVTRLTHLYLFYLYLYIAVKQVANKTCVTESTYRDKMSKSRVWGKLTQITIYD